MKIEIFLERGNEEFDNLEVKADFIGVSWYLRAGLEWFCREVSRESVIRSFLFKDLLSFLQPPSKNTLNMSFFIYFGSSCECKRSLPYFAMPLIRKTQFISYNNGTSYRLDRKRSICKRFILLGIKSVPTNNLSNVSKQFLRSILSWNCHIININGHKTLFTYHKESNCIEHRLCCEEGNSAA